jgi:hypothetical protein
MADCNDLNTLETNMLFASCDVQGLSSVLEALIVDLLVGKQITFLRAHLQTRPHLDKISPWTLHWRWLRRTAQMIEIYLSCVTLGKTR